jgi:hypothetical protein
MANVIDRGEPSPYYLRQEQVAGGWRDLSRHSSIDEDRWLSALCHQCHRRSRSHRT